MNGGSGDRGVPVVTAAAAPGGAFGWLRTIPLPACPPIVPLAALGGVIAALLVDVSALTLDLIRLSRLRNGATEANVGLDISSTLSGLANLLVPLAMLVAAASFIWWFASAYRRLAAAGPTALSPEWAILGWVVPGLNLFRPPQIMAELASVRPQSSTDRRGLILTVGWWLLLIEGMAIQIILRFITPTTNLGWTRWQSSALVSDLVLVAAAVCAITLVWMVERQLRPARAASKPDS